MTYAIISNNVGILCYDIGYTIIRQGNRFIEKTHMSLINAGIFPAKGWVNPVLFFVNSVCLMLLTFEKIRL